MTFHQDISLPGLRVLLIHPLLGLLKKAHGLLRLVGQVLHDHAEILVLPEDLHFALVSRQNGAQVLVGIRQKVQDVGWAVFQCHLRVLAQTHHLEQKHKDCKRFFSCWNHSCCPYWLLRDPFQCKRWGQNPQSSFSVSLKMIFGGIKNRKDEGGFLLKHKCTLGVRVTECVLMFALLSNRTIYKKILYTSGLREIYDMVEIAR